MPPTTSALIGARIDQLGGEERATLERGAVMGQLFYRDALVALAGGGIRAVSSPALTRKQFIHPDRSDLAGTDALAFRHLMIRDAAYEGIPKAERADIHERFADWFGLAVADRLPEYEEILGFHLERACRYREELGLSGEGSARSPDARGRPLRKRVPPGDRRIDLRAAASLLGRAIAVSTRADPTYPELLWEWGVVLNRQGPRMRRAGAYRGVDVGGGKARRPAGAPGAAGPLVGRRDRPASSRLRATWAMK